MDIKFNKEKGKYKRFISVISCCIWYNTDLNENTESSYINFNSNMFFKIRCFEFV